MLTFLFRKAFRPFLRGQRRPHRNQRAHRRQLEVELLERRDLLAGTWTPLTNLIPDAQGAQSMMLLSDGTVMIQGGADTSSAAWYKLTPNSSGSYINGTFTTLASMNLGRLFFTSDVLPSGKVLVVGGEYTGPSTTNTDTNTGEIYDPVANTWTSIANFPQSNFGDDPSEVLANGQVLGGYILGPQTYLYNPANNTWTQTGTKLRSDQSDEETWALLPDGSVLSYDVFSSISLGVGHAQRYVPSSGTWVDTGTVPVPLSSSSVPDDGNFFELGPGLLLPDGRFFLISGTAPFTGSTFTAGGNTALYTPSTNTWAAGPVIPVTGYTADDAPGAMLPNGQVLFLADTPAFNAPTLMFDFDPVANTITQVTLPTALSNVLNSDPAFLERLVSLPNGDVLLSTSSRQIWEFTPSGSPNAAWRPTISSITLNAGGIFTLTGTQLNGLSEGANYGDDAEMASNYPIVQLTSSGGTVYYAKTFNWTPQVASGSTPVTTQFTLPAGIPGGVYSLTVSANGISSAPISFPVASPLAVIGTTPATGAVLTTPPTTFVIDFNEAVVPSSVHANALQVNGISATSVALNAADTVATFTYSTSPVTAGGLQTIAIAANAITGTDSTGNTAFSTTFRYDAIILAVSSTNPAAGGFATVSAGSFTLSVTFNVPIDPATAATSNLTLSQGTVSAFTVLAGNQTVQYTISGLTTDSSLTVTIPAGTVMDSFDDPGFTPFSGTYQLDLVTQPYPTPLNGDLPAGSLVYTNGGISDAIRFTGDTDSFTLNIAAGQTITVLTIPSGTLQATLQLQDPTNTLLGSVTASGPGKKALLQTIPTTSAGVYTITIAGANGTVGGYTVQVTLNAALETENTDGPSDDTLATAQSIDGSFLSLGSAGTRGAVLGQTDLVGSPLPTEIEPNQTLATADSAIGNFVSYSGNLYHLGITGTITTGNTEYFTIGALQVGDFITISDSGASSSGGTLPDPFVELYRSNGGSPIRVAFDDDSGPGLDALVYRFAITTPDTYYVRAMGFGASTGSYSLGIDVEDNAAPLATGGTFTTATGTNTSFATANDASTSWRPVQYVSATTGTILTRGDTDFYQYAFTAGDLVSVTINSTSTLHARVNLLNASGAIVASEDGTSVGPGTNAPLYAVLIPSTGTYYVQVLGASGTGTYTDNVYLSTTTPPPHASPSGADYYAFTLAAGDTTTLAIKALSSGSVNLTLKNASGTTLATGATGPTNVNLIITDFTAASPGTYYALITGTAGTNYSLVLTRNAELNTEPNSTIATAQPMNSRQVAGTQSALGGLTSGDANYYAITLAANSMVQIATATPGYGSAAPANALDPLIRLFNASDTQVASASNNATDGHNAVISYTVPAGQGGTYYVEILPINSTTGDYILSLSGTLDPAAPGSASSTGLYVTSLTPTPSGFTASFSEPFINSSSSPIHLYDAASAGYGPADVTLVGQTTGAVQGSLLIDPSNSSFTFVKTGGVLAPDTYTVTFVSGATAFRDATGAPLNGDGANPVNYVTTFTVADSGAVVVSVPDFARGPDSADGINVPNNSTNGIPITLSNGSGVTDAVFVLQYDADLLTISGGSVNANLAGATFTVTTSGSGSTAQATIVFHSPTPLGSGAVQLGGLTATVPGGAGYGSEELLHFSSVSLNGGAIAAVGADAIHVAAFLGDTSGDGSYTSQDSVLLSNVVSGADSGFAAYPTVDPIVLGDINGNGVITAADVALLNRYLSGTAVAQVPNYPGVPGNQPSAGISAFSIPTTVQASPGGSGSVPAAGGSGSVPAAGDSAPGLADVVLSGTDLAFLEQSVGEPVDWGRVFSSQPQTSAAAAPSTTNGACAPAGQPGLGLSDLSAVRLGQPVQDAGTTPGLMALDDYFAQLGVADPNRPA